MHFVYVLLITLVLLISLELLIFWKTKRTSYFYHILGFMSILVAVTAILISKTGTSYEIFAIISSLILFGLAILMFVKAFVLRKKEGHNEIEKKAVSVLKQLLQASEYNKKCRSVYGWNKRRMVFKINSKNIEKKLQTLNIPEEVKQEIRSEVTRRKTVIVSEIPFQVDNWVGEKYLVID